MDRDLLEALYDCSNFVDPAEALDDDDGRWLPLGGPAGPGGNEQSLRQVRDECRALAVSNEFAINGHENRISYIVGSGFSYRAAPRPGAPPGSERLTVEVQELLDAFVRDNHWRQRQQEIVRRRDRDGEAFLRFFTSDGTLRVRFVEPDQVAAPSHRAGDAAATLGIQTDPDDVETVHGYWIDGRWVEAGEIQHRKANVDANVKRGLPLFYPVRKNLRRAEKLLRNMSAVAEIQSAIALIRKHAGGRAGVQQFVQGQADGQASSPGRGSYVRRYAPGTILDAHAGIEYQFPAAAIDAGRFVTVLQAELRAIAARLVLPEFMLTSDASNANYASTMVAEGPAVRMFQRLQHEMLEDDLEVMARVVDAAIAAGRLPRAARTDVRIDGVPPTLAVRDRLREAQADRILVECGAMTVAAMAARHGLDTTKG